MFCPNCGELTQRDDHFYCERGDMFLSQFVASGLENCFIKKTRLPHDKTGSLRTLRQIPQTKS